MISENDLKVRARALTLRVKASANRTISAVSRTLLRCSNRTEENPQTIVAGVDRRQYLHAIERDSIVLTQLLILARLSRTASWAPLRIGDDDPGPHVVESHSIVAWPFTGIKLEHLGLVRESKLEQRVAAMQIEFLVDVFAMLFDSARADEELFAEQR